MTIKFEINNKALISHLDQLTEVPKKLVTDAGKYFKDITPFKTGNARANTQLNGTVIEASYPYAGRLDDGYSKQAPKGMVDPTIEFIDKRLAQLVEKK